MRRRRLVWEKQSGRALSMQQPLTPEQAYRWFGTFLGLIPPLALFSRFIATSGVASDTRFVVALCVGMNIICCLAGRWYAGVLGRWIAKPRDRGRLWFVAAVFGMAVIWSLVTGGLGGALFFGIGAFFGFACALPVALAAFPVFAILHRLISRGGMIEARHTWPLAFGIPLTIAAMISSPWLK